jgi:agmatinase
MKKFLGKENTCNSSGEARVIILPIPFEYSTCYGKGTMKGPEAILKASEYLELYDEEINYEPWREGIYTTPSLHLENKPDIDLVTIKDAVLDIYDTNHFMVALGGEHTISYGIYNALNDIYADLSILHLDAHSDMRNNYEGDKFSHACVMRRIWELNNRIVQVGVRSQCFGEKKFITKNGINVFYAHEMHKKKISEDVLKKLGENVYITIDVDFFDPSIIPSTGTPEPGGFLWNESLDFLYEIFTKKNIVGFDVVELSPIENLHHADFLVAKLIYKLIAFYLKKTIIK